MSPNNLQPKQPNNNKDTEPQNNSNINNSRQSSSARPQEQSLKCPRCDSPNTKFCYYNNYSLTQPRHFCKTCRRYWTKGGALRNVPIGGGCRKNKKMKSSSSSVLSTDSKGSSGSSEIGGFKFFHGLSPAVDFNLGGLSPFPRMNPSLNTSLFSQFSSFGDIPATSGAHAVSVTNPSCFSLDHRHHSLGQTSSTSLMGFSYPLSGFNGAIHDMANTSMNVHTSLASSIESLSSINQDLHWKLQQQRLAMLSGGESQKDGSISSPAHIGTTRQPQKPQPISFQNLEISKPEASYDASNSRKDGHTSTEWFFGNSYAQMNTTQATSNSNGGNESGSNWNGVQAWNDLHQYNSLP